jgi:hypothetical protein
LLKTLSPIVHELPINPDIAKFALAAVGQVMVAAHTALLPMAKTQTTKRTFKETAAIDFIISISPLL